MRPVEELDDAEAVVDGVEQGAVARLAPGQRVNGRPLVGDVAHHAEEAHRASRPVALDLRPSRDPAQLAGVGAADAVLHVGRHLPGEARCRTGCQGGMLRQDQALDLLRRKAVAHRHAVEPAELGRRLQDVVLGVDPEHADPACDLGTLQRCLRLAQGFAPQVFRRAVA